MPAGGKVLVASDTVTHDADDVRRICGPARVVPGHYTRIRVSDTGTGIAPADCERIFEPFFTTKPLHQGTGLGLSTVYGIVKQANGIVKQANGYIFADSTLRVGTTFHVLVPVCHESVEVADPAPTASAAVPGQSGLIMVVDDDPGLLALTQRYLELGGYRTVGFRSAERALGGLAAQLPDCVVSDVSLGGASGTSLARLVRGQHPGVPVLLVSGFPNRELGESGFIAPDLEFLAKPFSRQALLERVAALLSAVRAENSRADT